MNVSRVFLFYISLLTPSNGILSFYIYKSEGMFKGHGQSPTLPIWQPFLGVVKGP